jgi:hypothetical protein
MLSFLLLPGLQSVITPNLALFMLFIGVPSAIGGIVVKELVVYTARARIAGLVGIGLGALSHLYLATLAAKRPLPGGLLTGALMASLPVILGAVIALAFDREK